MGNRLHTVKQILEADMYKTVDLKEKIITKSQSKQSVMKNQVFMETIDCLLYTSPSPRDQRGSRMPSSA